MTTYTGTPRTWSAGETVTAALMNSDVRDPLAAVAGAWTSYTPTLTGFTPGNGTASGAYLRVGKLVIFRAKFVFGSTSAGASATPFLTLPVTAATAEYGGFLSGVFYNTSGSQTYLAVCRRAGTTSSVGFSIPGTSGVATAPTATTPFGEAWATGDIIEVSGTYEAA